MDDEIASTATKTKSRPVFCEAVIRFMEYAGAQPYNVRVHRAAANKLNIETRATRGSVCNALLCRVFRAAHRFGCKEIFFVQRHGVEDHERDK